jgi:geranylgeranyl diphosphate synthase type II
VGRSPPPVSDVVSSYLEDCRRRVLDEIRRLVPASARHGGLLYELMLDYPLRHGKALRPALCIAACRLLGGHVESVLRSAAVLELYHNAFLIHDDLEDGSERRRNEATLHELHGVPIAVNVGDGMLALTLEPLLRNIELVGLGRALRILETVARMARESAEGQMMELEWVRRGCFTPSDRDYVRMVYKKTCWYTFLAPLSVGAIAAGADAEAIATLRRVATPLGIAFQIQDDVLNLIGDPRRYGKEIDGDLWEGKHTLVLIHAVQEAPPAERERLLAILRKRRPPSDGVGDPRWRTAEDVALLRERIVRSGAVDYAIGCSDRHASRARRSFESAAKSWAPSVHRDFLAGLVDFVVKREW